MSDPTCKLVEISASFPSCPNDADRQDIETEAKTLRHIQRFDVTKRCGRVVEGRCAHIQVATKVSLRLEG